MAPPTVLPLYPLVDAVLLPGRTLTMPLLPALADPVVSSIATAPVVVASLVDGQSVHEVGVRAELVSSDDGIELRGVERCRLLELLPGESALVRVERFGDTPAAPERERAVAALLSARAMRMLQRRGESLGPGPGAGLEELTWKVTERLGLTPEHQQGFLNVADALTRARLLLLVIRELERRERFLRPWAALRAGSEWN